MPARKLVQIGKPAPLPTVAEYFRDLSQRQGEDIRLLKERASILSDPRAVRRSQRAASKSVREESWRLHPVVPASKPPQKRSATKKRTAAKKRDSTKRRSG
jgi:hypothetical protein